MTFDQSVVLGCVAVPAAMMLVAVLVARQGRSTQHVSSLRNRILASGVAVTWCTSVWLAVTYRQGLQWMPDEF